MARPLRLQFPGAIYHLTSRGDGREAIYLDERDRLDFLALVGHVCKRFAWRCFAYCLMGNHYHLVVETQQATLSRGMRQLNGVYTQRFNRRHGRVGHVFQGRFNSIVVERDEHLLELARYVVLNPVRAGLVVDPGEWRWSSFRASVGVAVPPRWLDTQWLLDQFGHDRTRAVDRYKRFVAEGLGAASPWESLRHQVVLGGESFATELRRMLAHEPDREVSKVQRVAVTASLSEYQSHCAEPRVAMALAFLSGDYTMKAIAQHFDVHYMTVSRAVRWYEQRGGESSMLDCET